MLMHERGPQALTRALFKQLFTHQELLTATFSGKAGKAFDKNRLNIIQSNQISHIITKSNPNINFALVEMLIW